MHALPTFHSDCTPHCVQPSAVVCVANAHEHITTHRCSRAVVVLLRRVQGRTTSVGRAPSEGGGALGASAAAAASSSRCCAGVALRLLGVPGVAAAEAGLPCDAVRWLAERLRAFAGGFCGVPGALSAAASAVARASTVAAGSSAPAQAYERVRALALVVTPISLSL